MCGWLIAPIHGKKLGMVDDWAAHISCRNIFFYWTVLWCSLFLVLGMDSSLKRALWKIPMGGLRLFWWPLRNSRFPDAKIGELPQARLRSCKVEGFNFLSPASARMWFKDPGGRCRGSLVFRVHVVGFLEIQCAPSKTPPLRQKAIESEKVEG